MDFEYKKYIDSGLSRGVSAKAENILWKSIHPKTISDKIDYNKRLIDIGLLICDKFVNAPPEDDLKVTALQNFMMFIAKSSTLLQLSEGYVYKSNQVQVGKFVDFNSMFTVLRAQYESFCNINNIFVNVASEEERKLKYFTWKIAGLKNRQTYNANTEEQIQQQLTELEEIQFLQESILQNAVYINLAERGRKTKEQNIINVDKSDWKLVINGTSYRFAGWEDLFQNAGVNNFEKYYTFLSVTSHPTYLSMIQFKENYFCDSNVEKTIINILRISELLTCFCIADMCNYIPGAKQELAYLPKEFQEIFLVVNNTYRINNIVEI